MVIYISSKFRKTSSILVVIKLKGNPPDRIQANIHVQGGITLSHTNFASRSGPAAAGRRENDTDSRTSKHSVEQYGLLA